MKMLVWTNPEQMEIRFEPEPEPGDDEVLLQVEAVGICGSEIEGYLGHNSLRVPPLVMGHEFCGIVRRTGKGVKGVSPGQKATVNPLLSCGTCGLCRRGLVQLCRERRIIGIHRPGAFGEYVSVPASALHVVAPEANAFRMALAEPLACSLRAARRAMERHPFANVAVFGAGTIGLLGLLIAKILGASRTLVVDTNEARLKTPLKLGATAVFNAKEADYAQKLKDAAGPSGIDVVIDAAGFQATRSAAIDIVNPGGTVMNIGLGIDHTTIPVNVCIRNEINLLHSFAYQRQDFADALEILQSGKIDESDWSEIRPIEDGPSIFRDLVQGRVAKAKIFLTF